MKLSQLMQDVMYAVIYGGENAGETFVEGLAFDSRKVTAGGMFVCLEGACADGHTFIREAAERGASVFCVEKLVAHGEIISFPEGAVVVLTADTRIALARMSAAWFGYPAKKLKLIGVTGTKGKTTVTWMLRAILTASGHPTGLIGTLGIDTGQEQIPVENTTPESFTIHEYFAKMVDSGCEYVVMEVSSQAMKLKRCEGLVFLAGVFTNLGKDHIGPGEHENFWEYRYCKSQLFRHCILGIGNLDDLQCSYMFHRCGCRIYGYSCQRELLCKCCREGTRILRAENIRYQMDEKGPVTRFSVGEELMELRMPGKFNVYNALAAMRTAQCLGIEIEEMKKALVQVLVPGRMEQILNEKNIVCYVDYAHNAMSLEQVLGMLREYGPERLIVVFGCGGNRAKDRRFEMGRVAGRLADLTIITSDNPRFEEPLDIMRDIEQSVREVNGEYRMIEDRGEAITEAVRSAGPGDVILVAGKGHETYQEICGERYPQDDRQLVREAFSYMGSRPEADGVIQNRQTESEE